jgi:pimeloyl-ACP methyl ester carboxylesterase
VNPIVFGSRDRQLFGVHVPAQGRRKRQGAVICAPLGQEYERAHRACRMLGERLAGIGYDVLRFDYFGTGDSGGAGEDVTLHGCVQDTVAAVEEICALGSVRRVLLVGLRLGAAIADRAAAQTRTTERLVLWDPVSDGEEYLGELFGKSAEAVSASCSDTRYVRGYPLTDSLEEDLRAIVPGSFASGRVREILLVISEERAEHAALLEHLTSMQESVASVTIAGPRSWIEQPDLGAAAVPVDILDAIAAWGS